jgi:alpha-L-arabinofuranosidase
MTKTILAALLAAALAAAAQAQSIAVDAKQEVARVPRRLFGTNVRQNMESDGKIRDFLKETGITLFRYPDSVDAGYAWDWDAGGVMARDGKPMTAKLARIDTAIDLARDVKAEIFFTMNIHGSTPEQAARWVAEAKKRGAGGSFWCLGNEPYFPGDKLYVPREAYVDLVNRFAPAMRAADPAIRVGMSLGGPYVEEQADKGRDSFVVRGVKQHIDFIDFHFYTGRWEKDKGIDPRRIMAGSQLVKTHVAKIREILRREAPEKADKIEIHYWEWNGPPWPEVGGIQTLATALHAADTLGEMAKHGVKTAIQYNLQEHACGLIPGWEQENPKDWPTEPWNGRTVRPTAHAIRLWSREMGPVMVKSAVEGVGTYTTKDWHTLVNFQGEVPFVSAHATRSEDGRGLQLMVINRQEKDDLRLEIALEGFSPKPDAEVLTINGPSLTSTNDVTTKKPYYHSFPDAPDPVVKLERGPWSGAAAKFAYAFKAHSVTVLKLQAK